MVDWFLETGLYLLGVVLLGLCDTQLADAGVVELRRALPELGIVR